MKGQNFLALADFFLGGGNYDEIWQQFNCTILSVIYYFCYQIVENSAICIKVGQNIYFFAEEVDSSTAIIFSLK